MLKQKLCFFNIYKKKSVRNKKKVKISKLLGGFISVSSQFSLLLKLPKNTACFKSGPTGPRNDYLNFYSLA